MVDRSDDPKPSVVRRFEVIEGVGRRRRWPDEVKAAIVAASLAPGAVVAELARRHDVRAQQIHGWRRDAREGRLVMPGEGPHAATAFAPVVIAAPDPSSPARAPRSAEPALTIEADGVAVRVRNGADARLVEAAPMASLCASATAPMHGWWRRWSAP